MKILVAFGSKRGGTQGIADTIAKELTQLGYQVEIQSAKEVDILQAWDAVIVGGALYMNRWQKDARHFVKKHINELKKIPVWFFSSGPLDDSANQENLPPTPSVRKLMDLVSARGHHTFGGRLESEAKGFIAHAMAKQGRAGDWRNLESVKIWARAVAVELEATLSSASNM